MNNTQNKKKMSISTDVYTDIIRKYLVVQNYDYDLYISSHILPDNIIRLEEMKHYRGSESFIVKQALAEIFKNYKNLRYHTKILLGDNTKDTNNMKESNILVKVFLFGIYSCLYINGVFDINNVNDRMFTVNNIVDYIEFIEDAVIYRTYMIDTVRWYLYLLKHPFQIIDPCYENVLAGSHKIQIEFDCYQNNITTIKYIKNMIRNIKKYNGFKYFGYKLIGTYNGYRKNDDLFKSIKIPLDFKFICDHKKLNLDIITDERPREIKYDIDTNTGVCCFVLNSFIKDNPNNTVKKILLLTYLISKTFDSSLDIKYLRRYILIWLRKLAEFCPQYKDYINHSIFNIKHNKEGLELDNVWSIICKSFNKSIEYFNDVTGI